MTNLRQTYSDIYTRVGVFIGVSDNDSEAAPTGNGLTKCKAICDRGLRNFLYPIDLRTGEYYEWSFLRPLHTMPLLDGKWRYQLPEDFSSIITDPTYSDDDNFKQMARTTPDNIMNLRAAGVVNYAPYYYSIVTTDYDPAIGEFEEIWFYPEPDSTYRIQFYYKSDPTKSSNAGDFLPGGVKATEAILESCLAVAEAQEDDEIGIHAQLAGKLIQDLIIIDSKKDSNNVIIGSLYVDKCTESKARSDRAKLTVYDTELT